MLVFYIYILVLKSLFPLAKVLSKVYKKDKPTLDRKKLLKYGRLLNIKSRHKLIQLSCMVLGKSPLVNSLDQTPPNLTLTRTLTLTQVGIHRGGGNWPEGIFRTPSCRYGFHNNNFFESIMELRDFNQVYSLSTQFLSRFT